MGNAGALVLGVQDELPDMRDHNGGKVMTAHTPGPWLVDGIEVFAEADCEAHPVADCACSHTCRALDELTANARLIAAAPDMYEALVYMADLFRDHTSDPSTEDGWKNEELRDVWLKAQKAIAKAEGKS
jgi:hypothetical protein